MRTIKIHLATGEHLSMTTDLSDAHLHAMVASGDANARAGHWPGPDETPEEWWSDTYGNMVKLAAIVAIEVP